MNLVSKVPEHIVNLSPSDNALRALEDLVRQIALRDEVSEKEIFHSDKIVEICAREKLGRKDKLRLLRKYLENLRFPLKAKLETELTSCSQSILKTLGVRLELPEDLEGDSVSFKLKARSTEELADLAAKIKDLSEAKEAERIFAILAGEIDV